jgi:hypothetical protein
MQSVEINLARQSGIDAAEAGTVKTDNKESIINNPYTQNPVLRCAYEHGVRLVWRKNRLLMDGKTKLASIRRMPDLYTPGHVLPLR